MTVNARPSNTNQFCADIGWILRTSLIQGVYMAPIWISCAAIVPNNSRGLRNGLWPNTERVSDRLLKTWIFSNSTIVTLSTRDRHLDRPIIHGAGSFGRKAPV